MIDNFEAAWERWFILETNPKNPDAWHDDPDDAGGVTKYGIAQKYHPGIDVKNMTRDQAKELLRAEYWKRYGLHLIRDKALAVKTFTLSGFLGPGRAVNLLQQACQKLGAGIVADGKIGPATSAWINSYRHPAAIEEAFESLATTYLLAKNKSKYIAGHLIRVDA